MNRFPNVCAALCELKKTGKPELQSEAQIATDILFGKRPGLEQKYDALIDKLDRTYSRLERERDKWEDRSAQSPLAQDRLFAKAKVSAINHVLNDIIWMKARNRDLATNTPESVELKEKD